MQLYKELEPKARVAAADLGATCRKGCHHCCYMFMTISLPEGMVIAEHVFHKEPEWKPQIPQLMRKMYARVSMFERDAFDERDYFKKKIPCVFLSARGSCTIYEVRPAVCRYHYVTSDPSNCEPDNDEAALKIIRLPFESTIRSEGDRSSKQVGAPQGTMAPIPVAVLWGMKVLEEGVDVFKEGLPSLSKTFQVGYWSGRMARRALEAGAFELACTECDFREVMKVEDVSDRKDGCPQCDGTLRIEKSKEAEAQIRGERAD